MQRRGNLLILEPELTFSSGKQVVSLAALADADGLTLVDTGVPGMLESLQAELQAAGYGLRDVRRIVLTHHHVDHIGNVEAIVKECGAQVYASPVEIPDITAAKPLPEAQVTALLADPLLHPDLRTYLLNPVLNVRVDAPLHAGQPLPWADGTRIITTPGHTGGHLSLYLPGSRFLIAGDALDVKDGLLALPPTEHSAHMTAALDSVRQLAALDIEAVLVYHGGLIEDDVAGQLQRLSA